MSREIGEVVSMTPGKTDKQIAEELKGEFNEAMKPVIAVFEKARANGMNINFNMGQDPFGRFIIQNFSIGKIL